MIRSLKAALAFSAALMVGISLGAAPDVSRAYADVISDPTAPLARGAMPYQPIDPKKKMPGDACKTSDECQNHHTCTKVGEKNVCQAPPAPRLPPGAVT